MRNRKSGTGRRQHANVTVNDVAKKAGVSPMTVSRVVNNEDNVRPRTREAVNRAIDELGYRPNKAARSLASANPITIGLVYISPNNTFFSAMLRGLLDRAHHADTHIVIEETAPGPDTLRTIQDLTNEGVDGFMLGPPLCDSTDVLEYLQKRGIPAVTIGAEHEFEEISQIRVDDRKAAREMTKLILDLGHERIAFIIGNPEQSASWMRLDGFRESMSAAGLKIDEKLVVQGRFSYHSGMVAANRLLDMDAPPTAIIASNDDIAAGAIAAAHRRNLKVPRDLSIVGFDDTMLATVIEPPITTVRQPIPEMTHSAVEMLEKSIRSLRSSNGGTGFRETCPFELVLRNSHAPPPQT